MRKQIDPMLKTKLYLLAIGILILAVLLVKTKEEPQKQPEKTEPPTQEEEAPETEPEEEKEPERKTPVYNGSIRVLLKTDGFESEIHETVKLACGQELVVLGKGTDENERNVDVLKV